jgi:hypothetical protein
MDKDKSIITQVAAKIAAELTPKAGDVNTNITAFADAFDAVTELLMGAIYGGASAQTAPAYNEQAEAQMVLQTFPGATVVEMDGIIVRGTQHGELPSWLITACKKDGITEVYDNRDGLAANPKRPWFKAVNDKEKAYWPPRSK